MSDLADWTDRSTCILLGDGAGAAVVSASPTHVRIGPVVWGSDPTRSNAVRLVDDWQPRFSQEGQAVFRWTTSELPAIASAGVRTGRHRRHRPRGVVTHQANLRIIEAMTRTPRACATTW